MYTLEELIKNRVFHYFSEISTIPHGSHNTDAISNYLVEFAKKHELRYLKDTVGNVTIYKDATADTDNVIIIQGHMDMVCEKSQDCNKDMDTEGLDLYVDGDELKARGTTLGGDDGIAVAMALAILESDSITHPGIEAVFTVDEEVGMLGAEKYDASNLKGKMMLNIDSEVEGEFTVSCAGGVVAVCKQPIEFEYASGLLCQIKICGLVGGHSGLEIDKNRANAIVLLGRILRELRYKYDIRIVEVEGGAKDNAIANQASAVVMLTDENLYEPFSQSLSEMCEIFRDEYAVTDNEISVLHRVLGVLQPNVMTGKSTDAVIYMLTCLPNGIQRMSADVKGLVQTSLNMGILSTVTQMLPNLDRIPVKTPLSVELTFCVRSSVYTEKKQLMNKLADMMKMSGGEVEFQGEYPGWKYKLNSPLRDLMCEVYRKQYGKEARIEAVHAGVECGYFAEKIDELDCVSFGPQINNIHTVKESLNIPSVERTFNMVLEILERLI
ncbi:MAG: aminoacyl-histidine dipeptidase [Lachnospiraceae bacterium]|nr:aminoacyl-histidine dipeptidase [Candidatus Colinaster equi]